MKQTCRAFFFYWGSNVCSRSSQHSEVKLM